MKRLAIILGSETYKSYPDTDYCYADAELMRQTLENYCDYERQNIYYENLYSSDDSIYAIKLKAEIENILNKCDVGDTVIFYYAGHGTVHNDKAYLVLPDSDPSNLENTALYIDDLRKFFEFSELMNTLN